MHHTLNAMCHLTHHPGFKQDCQIRAGAIGAVTKVIFAQMVICKHTYIFRRNHDDAFYVNTNYRRFQKWLELIY